MTEIDRRGEASIAEQIAAEIERAVAEGEVMAGDKLPPTRELAELAGVNHLTAARAYRRLADRGTVLSKVGAGTFVRGAAAVAHEEPPAGAGPSVAWQHYALPEAEDAYADSILLDLFRTSSHAEDLIPLMTGYPSERIFPREQLERITAEVARREGDRVWQYAPPEGVPELREAFAERLRADGLDDGAERVVVTSGARQALIHTARAVASPGAVVACESPSFAGIISALRGAGLEVLPVPVDGDGLQVDALEQLLRHHEIRLLALQPRLQNPTGRDLSAERRERLVELARRHGFFIVEDSIYAPLRIEGEDQGALRAQAPEHVILVHSISKAISPGLRAGCAVASGPVLERIAQQKRGDDMASPTLPQLVAADFLAGDAWPAQRERSIAFHHERRDVLLAAIDRELRGLARPVHHPLGGAHVWVELERAVDERRLYAEAVRCGVNFMPAGATMPERVEGSFLRLSFSFLEPDELEEGVSRLGVALRAVRDQVPPRQALPFG